MAFINGTENRAKSFWWTFGSEQQEHDPEECRCTPMTVTMNKILVCVKIHRTRTRFAEHPFAKRVTSKNPRNEFSANFKHLAKYSVL